MSQRLSIIALVVQDYDDAVQYFTHRLRFTLVEDIELSPTKRWVVGSTSGGYETDLSEKVRYQGLYREDRQHAGFRTQ